MKRLKKSKGDIMFILTALTYIGLIIFYPPIGRRAFIHSSAYLLEMLSVMPPILILIALIDTWVPKQRIVLFLGNNSGIKGTVLSFIIGSVSAGPIYAAFPLCTMLRKKGASIQNIIIILSSWAVIKIPMLLQEAKYLGPSFMALRWLLTVIAILIYSYLIDLILKNQPLP